LAAMLAGEVHPEKVTCLNLGWAIYRENPQLAGKRNSSSGRRTGTRRRRGPLPPGGRIWLLPVSVNDRDAEAVKRALARMAAGDRRSSTASSGCCWHRERLGNEGAIVDIRVPSLPQHLKVTPTMVDDFLIDP